MDGVELSKAFVKSLVSLFSRRLVELLFLEPASVLRLAGGTLDSTRLGLVILFITDKIHCSAVRPTFCPVKLRRRSSRKGS